MASILNSRTISNIIILVGAFSVPLESLGSLNKSSMIGDFRLVGESRGGGVGGLLEGAHQIHCLVRRPHNYGLKYELI